ncbi:MAG TPA: hypothetical protein VLV18_01000 [Terriglobales bacterium]|nr:hypothetical protein [Terriglobales bacterium]
MVDLCPICRRPKETADQYCALHLSALHNLELAYPQWNKAYSGKLSQTEYYKKLLHLNETGEAAKALIRHVLQEFEGS